MSALMQYAGWNRYRRALVALVRSLDYFQIPSDMARNLDLVVLFEHPEGALSAIRPLLESHSDSRTLRLYPTPGAV